MSGGLARGQVGEGRNCREVAAALVIGERVKARPALAK